MCIIEHFDVELRRICRKNRTPFESPMAKHDGMKCWVGFAFISFIELFSGAMALLKPVELAVGFNHVIGIIFFVQSAGFFLKASMYKELIK